MESNAVLQIVVLAVILESVVQTVKPIWEPAKRTVEFYVTLGVGMALSVAVNYLAGLDLFTALGVPLLKLPVVGVILTGVLMSRGAGVFHDIWKAVENLKLAFGQRSPGVIAEK